MKKNSSQIPAPPKNFDIEEISKPSNEKDKMVVQAGEVEEWKHLKLQKARMRPYITGIVILAWVIYITIGITRLMTVGDVSLLLSSPVLFIGPLNIILNFYFER
jgi:hypothetical protein